MQKLSLLLLIALFPADDHKTFFNRGMVNFQKNDYSQAVNNFNESYKLKKHAKTSYYLALSYFYMDKDSLANDCAVRALKENPQLADSCKKNINYIIQYVYVAPRFRKLKFTTEQSTADEETQQDKEAAAELKNYYWGDDGARLMMKDMTIFLKHQIPYPHKTESLSPLLRQRGNTKYITDTIK